MAVAADRVVHVRQHIGGAAALDLSHIVGLATRCISERDRTAALQRDRPRHAQRCRAVAGTAAQRDGAGVGDRALHGEPGVVPNSQ